MIYDVIFKVVAPGFIEVVVGCPVRQDQSRKWIVDINAFVYAQELKGVQNR